MQVLTAGDSNFCHCMSGLAQSVRKFYGEQLIVYDIGLTKQQKKEIDAEIRHVKIDIDFSNFTKYKETDFINATHKAFCIKDYFENDSDRLIYIDADCVFREKIELDGFDITITVKPSSKMDTSNYYNGIINTGVIFFNTYPKKLIDRWIEECSTGDHTDQSSLAKILSETIDWKETGKVHNWHGISVKTLPIETYNDYYLRSGKVFHFKGRRHEPKIYDQLIEAMEKGEDVYSLFQKLTKKKSILNKIRDNYADAGHQ